MKIRFLNKVDLELNKITNLIDGVDANHAINYSQLNNAVSNILSQMSSALIYKGDFDPSSMTFEDIAEPSLGDFYSISGDAIIDGMEFKLGDKIIINKDVVGDLSLSDIDLIKNTEFTNTVFFNSEQNLSNKAIDALENSILNIVLSNFKMDYITFDILNSVQNEIISDLIIPTAKSVQDYIHSGVANLKEKISGKIHTADITGDSSSTSFFVNHFLDCDTPLVRVINTSNNSLVFPYVRIVDGDSIIVDIEPADLNKYKVLIYSTKIAKDSEYTPEQFFVYEDYQGVSSDGFSAMSFGVVITGYDLAGGSDIKIPPTLDGKDVLLINESAFSPSNYDAAFWSENSYIPIISSEYGNDDYTIVGLFHSGNKGYLLGGIDNKIESVHIPDSVVSVMQSAFKDNSNLHSVRLSVNMDRVAEKSFSGCNINTLAFPTSITSIDDDAFAGNNIIDIRIYSGVNIFSSSSLGLNGESLLSPYLDNGGGHYQLSNGDWSYTPPEDDLERWILNSDEEAVEGAVYIWDDNERWHDENTWKD